ncbi:MAG TPA: VPLPA-CTERM sorting domain-containing protein [Paracoccaceae bacterium]
MFAFTRITPLAAAALAAGIAWSGAASAAVYTSSGTCTVSDLTVAADDCFGTVLPVPTNVDTVDLNADTFGGLLGLFGNTNWSFLTKVETGAGGGTTEGTDIGLTLDPDTGGAPGSWEVNPGSLSGYDFIAIILKQGRTWAAYLYEGVIPESGDWTSDAFAQDDGLSHFSIYTGPVTPIPLPAAGFLLIGALGGLGVIARRRKTA